MKYVHQRVRLFWSVIMGADSFGVSARWRRVCVRECARVCGSSSGQLKACWEACHRKSGKGSSPKCTEERAHHPPLSLFVFLSPLLPWSLDFSPTLIYTQPTCTVLFQLCQKVTLPPRNRRMASTADLDVPAVIDVIYLSHHAPGRIPHYAALVFHKVKERAAKCWYTVVKSYLNLWHGFFSLLIMATYIWDYYKIQGWHKSMKIWDSAGGFLKNMSESMPVHQ